VDLSQRLRLLGVRVGKLSRPGEVEPPRRGRAAATAEDASPARPKPENLPLFN
jgi:DNA polymerase-4